MNDFTYTVMPIDGSFLDVLDPGTESLRYDGLSWDEAVELCRLSFMQGFEVVIWRVNPPEGGIDECGEEQTEAPITN